MVVKASHKHARLFLTAWAAVGALALGGPEAFRPLRGEWAAPCGGGDGGAVYAAPVEAPSPALAAKSGKNSFSFPRAGLPRFADMPLGKALFPRPASEALLAASVTSVKAAREVAVKLRI